MAPVSPPGWAARFADVVAASDEQAAELAYTLASSVACESAGGASLESAGFEAASVVRVVPVQSAAPVGYGWVLLPALLRADSDGQAGSAGCRASVVQRAD